MRFQWRMDSFAAAGIRKGATLALVMTLLLNGIAFISAPSAGLNNGDFKYRLINGDNEVEITGYTGLGGAVVIPNEIGGMAVTSIGDSAFIQQRFVTSVVIPEGVRSIGPRAFQECGSLTSINIPDSTTMIGDSAFRQCVYLVKVDLGSGLTSLGSSVFQGCSSLTSVNFSQVLITIGNSAFSDCTALASFELPGSLTSLGELAFSSCQSLTEFKLPNGVFNLNLNTFYGCNRLSAIDVGSENPVYATADGLVFNKAMTALIMCPMGRSGHVSLPAGVLEVSKYAFRDCAVRSVDLPNTTRSINDFAFIYCYNLFSINIGSGLQTIGTSAFEGCDSLTRLDLPEGLTAIGDGAFNRCRSLITFDVDPGNQVYASQDGMLYDQANSVLMVCPEGRTGHVDIVEGTLKIGTQAFNECSSVTSVSFPSSLTEIEYRAFAGCGLTSATLPDGMIGIGDGAFASCLSLETVELPSNLIELGERAFRYCVSLLSADIPEGITEIGHQSFYECQSLLSVSLPDGLTTIGAEAFVQCSSLRTMLFPASLTTINYDAFSGCTSLLDLYFKGDAPMCGEGWISFHHPDLKVYYRPEASGFTTPTWQELPSNASSVWRAPSPTSLMAGPGDGHAVLTWQAPETGEGESAQRYIVYVDGEPLPVQILETTYDVTGLTNGRTYSFRVTAVNLAGEGSPSATVSTVPGPVPATPGDLRFTSDLDSVTVGWDTVPGANLYLVFRVDTSSQLVYLASTVTSSYMDSGLQPGTVYYYAVAAVNDIGEGAVSDPLEAYTLTTVVGIVLSDSGAPLNGVTVRMQGAGDTRSNINGTFVLLAAPGEREIIVEGQGLRSRTIELEVEADGTDMGVITVAEEAEVPILMVIAIAVIIVSIAVIVAVVYLGRHGRKKEGKE